MKEFFKEKGATVLVGIATIILAGIAVFTAIRLYQLRQQSVAPNAPQSTPLAADKENMLDECHAVQVTCEHWGIYLKHPSYPFNAIAEYQDISGNWIQVASVSSPGADEPKEFLFPWGETIPPTGASVRVKINYNSKGERILDAGIMPECESGGEGEVKHCTVLTFNLVTSTATPTPTGNVSATPTPTTPIGGPSSTLTPTPTTTTTSSTPTPTKPVGGISSTLTPTSASGANATESAQLPPAGFETPTIIAGVIGGLLILLSLALAF